jgi:hypothetical protein
MEHAIVRPRPLAAILRSGHYLLLPERSSGPLRQKTFPIDFADKFPAAKRRTRCQSVVRLCSTIRMAHLQAVVLLEFLRMYFQRDGLFRNDKGVHSLVELDAPFSVRRGISRR